MAAVKKLLQKIIGITESPIIAGANAKMGIILAAILSFAVFLLLSFNFHFTLNSDDYVFLVEMQHGSSYDFSASNPYFSRVPLWLISAYFTFAVFPWSHSFIGMYFYFSIYALAFALLAYYCIKSFRLKVSVFNFVLLTTVFALYPTHYEVLYWPTCMPYIWGLLALAGALLVRNPIAAIALLSVSFFFSEMYILPALMLLCLPVIVGKQRGKNIWRELAAASKPWIISIIVVLAFQIVSSLTVSSFYHFPLALSPAKVISNIDYSVKAIIGIHFYEMNELGNFIYWSLLAYLFAWLVANKKIKTGLLAAVLLTCFLATAVHWLIGYTAPRALFGAQVYFNLIMICLLAMFLADRTIYKYLLPLAFAAVFIVQSLFIFSVKDNNYRVLQSTEQSLLNTIRQCPQNCNVRLFNLDYGLARDWVLYKDFWIAFARWTQYENGIDDKKIEYIVGE